MEEVWRDIDGYEGLYQVSNLGRVKRVGRYKKVLSPIIDSYGYLKVNLSKKSKVKKMLLHRLVAQAFIPNPHNYPVINHKDEDKTNNCVENLEWCTVGYNNAYSKSKPVIQYTMDDEIVRKWLSIRDVERELSFDTGFISKCCKGHKKSAYGFKWQYADS